MEINVVPLKDEMKTVAHANVVEHSLSVSLR